MALSVEGILGPSSTHILPTRGRSHALQLELYQSIGRTLPLGTALYFALRLYVIYVQLNSYALQILADAFIYKCHLSAVISASSKFCCIVARTTSQLEFDPYDGPHIQHLCLSLDYLLTTRLAVLETMV